MPRSHFHFLIHICLLDSEQIMEQKHFGRQWPGRDSRVEGWCFKCVFSSACIDFSPLHFVTAKCSGQKCNKTGSQSCSWGQEGHRSLHWCVGNISQMTEAQLENSKWLQSDVGAILHVTYYLPAWTWSSLPPGQWCESTRPLWPQSASPRQVHCTVVSCLCLSSLLRVL